MSSLGSQPISIKEIKEVYEMLPKEQLVSILIEKTLEIRKLREVEEKDTPKLTKPMPPLSRIIRERTIGTCPKCGSTENRKYGLFGRKIGCINERCENYYK